MLNLDEGIVVLSLFDGMACGRIALKRAGIKVKAYYASEIDKPAMKVAKHNWPDIIHIGDVTKVFYCEGWLFTENGEFYVGKIDLLIGGSPCQGFSNTGNGENFNHIGSKLFYQYLRLKKETECEYFFLENVKMKGEWRDKITEYMQVNPIMIDSQLVSAQKRRRYYWTNIPDVLQPKDKQVYIKDILLGGDAIIRWQNSKDGAVLDFKSACLKSSSGTDIRKKQQIVLDINDEFLIIKEATKAGIIKIRVGEWFDIGFPGSDTRRGRLMKDKSNCLTATKINWLEYLGKGKTRPISPIECERLQTVPDNYSDIVSNTQRYKMLGNGWTVDVIVHLFEPLLYVI